MYCRKRRSILKLLQFISCGSLLWNYKLTDFLTQIAQAQNV